MTAIGAAIGGFFDYAGLFPPAGVAMPAAVRNYLDYSAGDPRAALGRFVVDLRRLEDLRAAAGARWQQIDLSLLVPGDESGAAMQAAIAAGFNIRSIECAPSDPASIARLAAALPPGVEAYFEIPLSPASAASRVQAIAARGACAKLRMGGVTPEAFPPSATVVAMLQLLHDNHAGFKATAGLHHPVRSRRRLTYADDAPWGWMHGFLNLIAAALLVQDAQPAAAVDALEESEPGNWTVTQEALAWRGHRWTVEGLAALRGSFFRSIGSCSFTEPICDLEALHWL